MIDMALKKYEDQLLLEEINKANARLKADKKAWGRRASRTQRIGCNAERWARR